ncbi:MAG TPA: SIS domain-containing protein [Candidatus Acidoferrum sp.]|nr:SIS domain-containing protein [Candidatus Acidoferrum sp.]
MAQRLGMHLRDSILQQPDAVRRLLANGQPARAAADRLRGCSRVFLVGTGTSFHGSLVGQFLFRSIGYDAYAVPAFEFSQYPPRLVPTDGLILLSHRGSKRFSRASLELMRDSTHWVVITGEGSPLEGEGVVTTVPQEMSPVHTISHIGALVRLVQMAMFLDGMQSEWAHAVADLPSAVTVAVALESQTAQVLDRTKGRRLVSPVGGGPAWATALEGALKIREATYVPTIGYEVEEILHGPMTGMDAQDTAVLIVEPGPSLARMTQVAAGMKEIGIGVIAVGSAADQVAADQRIVTPELPELLAPLVNVVPFQWMAYQLADSLGIDADTFRRNELRHAAAYERYEL